MMSARPAVEIARRLLRMPLPDLKERAVERWEIAPAITRPVPPALFLPGQLDRIQGTEFGSMTEVVRDFEGGFETHEGSTLGFHLRDVDLVDGVLYSSGAVRHLRPKQRRRLAYKVPPEVAPGALYESWIGNRWFGTWLSDDCVAYPLAERYGSPVTTSLRPGGHVPRYEKLLGMTPRRTDHAHFEELTLFFDNANNDDRKARASQLRDKVMTAGPSSEHPGVFLLRGQTGERRVLLNEREIAEHLAATRGFSILDPSTASVEEIVAACARARVVAGVEGSHLSHGLMLMPPEATLLVLQPPNRVVSVLKIVTDRQGQGYAFVVGEGGRDGFTANRDEVERTLDLAL